MNEERHFEEVTVTYTEYSEEYKANILIGSTEYTDVYLSEVKRQADEYVKMLSNIGKKSPSFHLSVNGKILVKPFKSYSIDI